MINSTSPIPPLNPQLAALAPALVVFDKDGTLIDFHAMWGDWITELARQLETVTGIPIGGPLFKAMSFDATTGRIDPHGELALTPMAGLRALTSEVLCAANLPPRRVEEVMNAVWYLPDPVSLARPLTDLARLFSALRRHGAQIAVATSDNHAPTEAMLSNLRVASLVDAVICADDDVPIKPAPDMILTVCRKLNILPAKTVMVGDNVPDLQMGRAAGVGLTVGVLSGVGTAADLAADADILLSSVKELLEWGAA